MARPCGATSGVPKSGILNCPRWEVLKRNEEAERQLVSSLGVSPLVARVLAARGIGDVEAARRFLAPSLDRDWADPLIIPGMREAADRVQAAIARKERIAVIGDFDVDGMTATCLLTLALRRLGADVFPYIPYRFGEGYGLSNEALTRMREGCDPDLVITVDNGIASAREVEGLLAAGVDVVITDHHEPGDLVPQGVPVTDPKLEPDCYSRELAGAGVALKLVCELGKRLGMPDLWREYTEVAALGTVSDMMLLEGENRALVADGMARMRFTGRPGLVALAATASVDLSTITSDELPFSLVPRLNAAGRMGTTDVALNLLLTDDPAEAAVLAAQLESTNTERRDTESLLTEEALDKVARTYKGGRVVVVGGEGWHEGVKGIVASRIVNRYHVPAILFSITDGIARGSGRSVGDVDLFHAVEQCSDLLIRFGGHAGAVGVTCEAKNLDLFRERLDQVMSTLPSSQFTSRGEVTALVDLDELTCDAIGSLEKLQPFGQGNKKPLFGVRGVCMRNRARVGVTGNHLRFVASDGMASVAAIMFRTPEIERASAYDGAVDLVFEAVNETWQGKTKPKLMVRDILYRDEADAPEGQATLSDELFSKAEEVLSRDDYAGISDARSFFTKAVGVSFEGRQSVVATLSVGQELLVRREPANAFDPNAMALVTVEGLHVGFLRRQISASLAPLVDRTHISYTACVTDVTGGTDGHALGVNVCVTRADDSSDDAERTRAGAVRRGELSSLSPSALDERLRQAMIGDHALLPAQREALSRLAQGRSTFAVMATGRGKSLIFHMHAAREALLRGRASVFVYPLRALVSDQAFHLSEAFGDLGMSVRVLTGETPSTERDETFSSLAEGTTDVILTTPEFLVIHKDRFARAGRIGFVVIDEAHHAGMAKGGNRGAYLSMPEVLDTLGRPVTLAVSATASDEVARTVCDLLAIRDDDVVVDRSVRANLSVADCRELRDRDAALVSVVARAQKTVVYVNSREQSISLARMLRHAVPELAPRIAFYNAGLTRADRTRVEEAFRDGTLTCIVSTSAFGEGVNLPDIRNVMLYHLPFGQVEFNQMSGRAGRDGDPARIWLLFGSRDARINERIIASSAPERRELVALYRTLRDLSAHAREQGQEDGFFTLSNAEIAERSCAFDVRATLDDQSVSTGVSIFRELGLVETTGYGVARRISVTEAPGRVDLEQSIRYLEGLHARDEFVSFRDWALSSEADEMLARINRPITPGFGQVVDE
ncbi:MAG: single-stranded-DNA-specific exonuclease RecJ [Atopobiaceae bacterium]|nr:single-stranded-DNA-specific exonuclease RecJ [Atopobiaceae bacterium]